MNINFSLSLKITIIVVFVSTAIIFSLTYININWQEEFFEDDYRERAEVLASSLDASIESQLPLNKTDDLQKFIENVNLTNQDLLLLNVCIKTEAEDLITYVSSDLNQVGKESSEYNYISFNQSIKNNEKIVVLIKQGETRPYTITIISPINISGEFLGTYEMVFSMEKTYVVLDTQINYLILISTICVFVIVFIFLLLLRKTIVKPIISLRDNAQKVGKGDLDTKIDINSNDELGELAFAFNQMTIDLKKSRDKINMYSKTLEKLLDQKDEFIGQLGHDLKNPLVPLVGLLPMIVEKEKDENLKEHLKIILKNVEFIRDLIFETLELARLRSSKIKFDFQNINLSKEITNIVEQQKLYLKENKMDIKNRIKDNIFVKADRLRLAELINNLISNAVKYTKDSKEVIIDAKKEDKYVTISFTDNGIGMTKEQIDRIFDEFYMADESRRRVDSSGLGLSICKRIVEKHGGKIWVDSPGPNKGSTFYFKLKNASMKK